MTESAGGPTSETARDVVSAQAAPELLALLLAQAVRQDASDLHLRPGAVPKVRVGGELVDLECARLSGDEVAAVVEASMSDEVRTVFRDRLEADYAVVDPSVGRFRANAFRTRGEIGAVLRRVRDSALSLEQLSMPEVLRHLALRTRGLVLVTGPTGSGKSTTLAAMIDTINTERAVHVLTLEDPIEVLHVDRRASITQRELGSDTLDWSGALRAAMRQDPDVILIGELRDTETVHAALTAAETGHLVLGSMHTNDARETVHRLVEFFPADEQQRVRAVLSGTLEGVVCQRLVPRTDGSGRVCVLEIGVRDARFAEAVAVPERTHDLPDILASGGYSGMQTFDQHLLRLVMSGEIDAPAAAAAASNAHDLSVMLRRAGWIVRTEAAPPDTSAQRLPSAPQ